MLEKIPSKFKNKYRDLETFLKCIFCEDEMTQNHCTVYPGREEHRRDLDTTNLDDLVK